MTSINDKHRQSIASCRKGNCEYLPAWIKRWTILCCLSTSSFLTSTMELERIRTNHRSSQMLTTTAIESNNANHHRVEKLAKLSQQMSTKRCNHLCQTCFGRLYGFHCREVADIAQILLVTNHHEGLISIFCCWL
jgi:hypothetical protein